MLKRFGSASGIPDLRDSLARLSFGEQASFREAVLSHGQTRQARPQLGLAVLDPVRPDADHREHRKGHGEHEAQRHEQLEAPEH